MRRLRENASKSAFTLYELILVCAMLVLIAGVVASLVIYMNSYSNSVETNSEYISALVDVREQTDIWFSRVDEEGNAITAEEKYDAASGATTWVSCGTESYIATCPDDDGCKFVFCYGGSIKSVSCPFDCSFIITKYDDNYAYEQNENARLVFSVNLPVRGEKYVCEVVYNA